jgi:hypothetical protein
LGLRGKYIRLSLFEKIFFRSELIRSMEHGAWSIEHGTWKMEHGA